jgi:hypothetical protein
MTTANTSCAPIGTVADLLLRVRDGDPAAWEEIVRRYGAVVFATVRSFRLQDADAVDAAQTTWLRLAEHAHQIQHPKRLESPWVGSGPPGREPWHSFGTGSSNTGSDQQLGDDTQACRRKDTYCPAVA